MAGWRPSRAGPEAVTAGVSAAASAMSAHAWAGPPKEPSRPPPNGRTADSSPDATMPAKATQGNHVPGLVRLGARDSRQAR